MKRSAAAAELRRQRDELANEIQLAAEVKRASCLVPFHGPDLNVRGANVPSQDMRDYYDSLSFPQARSRCDC